jgi:hypothetical protein
MVSSMSSFTSGAIQCSELRVFNMLPPIPQGLVPVIYQSELVRPPVEVPAVAPISASEQDAAVSLSQRHPEEVAERLREEQRRRRRKGLSVSVQAGLDSEQADEARDNTLLRRGQWVDIEV